MAYYIIWSGLFTFMFISPVYPSNGIIQTRNGTFDIFAFGIKTLQAIRSFDKPEAEVQANQLVEEIEQLQGSVYGGMVVGPLQSQFKKIDDAVIAFHSSLIDLKNILRASKDNRDGTISLYLQRFTKNSLSLRFAALESLHSTNSFLDTYSDNIRCNMTAFYEFKAFYIETVSVAVALHLVQMELSKLNMNKVISHWEDEANLIDDVFRDGEERCRTKFSDYANEDVANSNNAENLWNNNNVRYLSKWNDVFQYSSTGGDMFQYFKYRTKTLFRQSNSNKQTIAIFGDRVASPVWNAGEINAKLNASVDDFRNTTQASNDTHSARSFCDAVELFLKKEGLEFSAIIAFFEDDNENKFEHLFTDKESPVASVFVEGVSLQTQSVHWITKTDTLHGRFRVYVYPSDQQYHDADYETGGQQKLKYPFSWFALAISLVIVTNLF